MLYISHRGNIDKKDTSTENSPSKIEICIKSGYDVEVDIRYIHGDWWLGHDENQYKVSVEWINKISKKLWIHCKNYEALFKCHNQWNYFWHEKDSYTITSKGYIWAYPGCSVNHRSVCVMPEWNNHKTDNIREVYAICSDNIEYCKQQYKIR